MRYLFVFLLEAFHCLQQPYCVKNRASPCSLFPSETRLNPGKVQLTLSIPCLHIIFNTVEEEVNKS